MTDLDELETRLDRVYSTSMPAEARAHIAHVLTEAAMPNATKELITIYIDSSTYLIRRIETRDVNDASVTQDDTQLDVTSYQTVSPSQVPPGTFKQPTK